MEWDTRQEQQAANLLIAAWLSDITFVLGFLGLDKWPCMWKRTNEGIFSQAGEGYTCDLQLMRPGWGPGGQMPSDPELASEGCCRTGARGEPGPSRNWGGPLDGPMGFPQCLRKICSFFLLFRTVWVPFCQVTSAGWMQRAGLTRGQTQDGNTHPSVWWAGGRRAHLSQSCLLILVFSTLANISTCPLGAQFRNLGAVHSSFPLSAPVSRDDSPFFPIS